MAKKVQKKQFNRSDYEVRPVTKEDRWCKFKRRLKESEINSPAPYGYVVIIPQYSDKMPLDVNGVIIKSRVFQGKLYLQVIPKNARDYCTVINVQEYPKKIRRKTRKKKAHYMNIRNISKGNPED